MSYKAWLKNAEGLLEGLDKQISKQVSAREAAQPGAAPAAASSPGTLLTHSMLLLSQQHADQALNLGMHVHAGDPSSRARRGATADTVPKAQPAAGAESQSPVRRLTAVMKHVQPGAEPELSAGVKQAAQQADFSLARQLSRQTCSQRAQSQPQYLTLSEVILR